MTVAISACISEQFLKIEVTIILRADSWTIRCKMDAELLINEVYKRMALWNQTHPDHHNRYIVEKQWVIGTADAAKNKWKNLRDTFRKELAKIPKPKSGDGGTFTLESRWK
ncbi:hypothetical protein FQR65_LT04338 [Abscondita terminalis]|nr:hypothetical protein FQR65_LT04338 [Abscondita terminalis]